MLSMRGIFAEDNHNPEKGGISWELVLLSQLLLR